MCPLGFLVIFIVLRCIPFIPSFFRTFIMKVCWILTKDFSVSVEMIFDFYH
jgi:uncharacterized membrane protein YdjX (TVP38/TMEM64 family)